MNAISRGLLAGAISVAPILASVGCEVEAPVPGGYAQVDLVDAHGYHHHGYYDHDHHWHGGWDDENHVHHDDAGDWHQ